MTDTVEVPGEQGPEVDELQQLESSAPEKYPPLCVTVDGPVNSRALPAVNSQIISKAVDTTTPIKLLGTSPQRGLITLCADQNIYIARTKGEASAGVGRWPADTPLTLRAPVDYWAMAVTVAGTVTLVLDEWAH